MKPDRESYILLSFFFVVVPLPIIKSLVKYSLFTDTVYSLCILTHGLRFHLFAFYCANIQLPQMFSKPLAPFFWCSHSPPAVKPKGTSLIWLLYSFHEATRSRCCVLWQAYRLAVVQVDDYQQLGRCSLTRLRLSWVSCLPTTKSYSISQLINVSKQTSTQYDCVFYSLGMLQLYIDNIDDCTFNDGCINLIF